MNQESRSFKNKKVVIFGLGSYKYGSGISAAKFFIKHGARILITDASFPSLKNSIKEIKNFSRTHKNKPVFVVGKQREKDFKSADIVMRNPGISNNNKFLKISRRLGIPVYTDVSLFLKLLGDLYHHDRSNIILIGVTGTRGKSTTSALLAEILKKTKKRVFLGGNLGYSPLNFLDKLVRASKLGETHIVLELSSWLVESLEEVRLAPKYALITNIYPDHLNKYKSMKDYINAKAVIFKYQNAGDVLVLNQDNKITRDLAKRAKSEVILFSKLNLAKLSRFCLDNLPGEHNRENIAAALTMAKVLGVSKSAALKALKKFKGLWGRLQFVRELRGVKFYNDTTATMPEAAIAALRTLKSPVTGHESRVKNIILIAGGADKNLDYKELAKEIPKYAKTLILFKGEASDKLNLEFRIQNSEFRYFFGIDNMKEAVRLAWKNAKSGDIILLSPAAASFNMFQNEVARGEQFVRAVKKLV